MRECSWETRRVEVRIEGEIHADRCRGCGALRLSILRKTGDREIFTTDPEPLPEECPGGKE